MSKLNLGSGPDYKDGWTNVDINPAYAPDIVLDLESTKWPFSDGDFNLILADNVFEHIRPRDRPGFLQECHRVLSDDGELVLRWPTPGFGGGWDVTHYSIPSWEWPDHPNHRSAWETSNVDFEFNKIGSILPSPIAIQLMRHGFRTILSVELTVTPTGTYGPNW